MATSAATNIDRLGRMLHHCQVAEQHLRDANPTEAVREARLATSLASGAPSPSEAEISVRAVLAEVDGLALANQLEVAEERAFAAVVQANLTCPGARYYALAELRLAETLELQRRYRAAAEGFMHLEENLPRSWADIKLWCANHLISIGVHSANRELQDVGIARGAAVRAQVSDPDQVASYLQWRGIAESRRGLAEQAEQTFEESFPMRDRTVRRDATKGFLLADVAYAHGDQEEGDRVLRSTLTRAAEVGLARHAQAGLAHLERFGPSVS